MPLHRSSRDVPFSRLTASPEWPLDVPCDVPLSTLRSIDVYSFFFLHKFLHKLSTLSHKDPFSTWSYRYVHFTAHYHHYQYHFRVLPERFPTYTPILPSHTHHSQPAKFHSISLPFTKNKAPKSVLMIHHHSTHPLTRSSPRSSHTESSHSLHHECLISSRPREKEVLKIQQQTE